MTPFDPKIERTACSIKRAVREATLTQRTLFEDNSLVSLDSEEEISMKAIPPPITGDYCKRTNERQFSRGFVPANPANFGIKNYVLSGLRYNPFDRNVIRDLWEHLACFYETTSMCRPTEVSEDQVKLRLFGFLLIERAKDWLLFLPNETIQTWKELEDNFLERFFTTTQFAERRAEITNFEQQEIESLYDSW